MGYRDETPSCEAHWPQPTNDKRFNVVAYDGIKQNMRRSPVMGAMLLSFLHCILPKKF
jgi:hypothetical protein